MDTRLSCTQRGFFDWLMNRKWSSAQLCIKSGSDDLELRQEYDLRKEVPARTILTPRNTAADRAVTGQEPPHSSVDHNLQMYRWCCSTSKSSNRGVFATRQCENHQQCPDV
ncbi:hypothetical protein WJX77_006044 [Trebouxia sp. C0004]